MNLRRELLDDYFISEGLPCWKVWNGRSVRGNPMKSHMKDTGVDDGLASLKDFLDMVDGGVVTITLHSTGNSKASSQISVNLGGSMGKMVGQVSQQRESSFDQMLKMFSFSQTMMQQQMASMREVIETKTELKYLKEASEQGEQMSPKDVALMELATSIGPAIQGIFGVQPTAQLGTMGQSEAEENETDTTQQKTKATSNKISFDNILDDLNRIRRAMPEVHINVLVRGLANYIENDTEKAKQMLAFIIPQK